MIQIENKFTTNIKTNAIKGAGANIIAQIVTQIAHIIGVIILARLLKPRDFGLVTMVSAFSLLFMNFGINGFTEYIIQKNEIRQEELNNIFWLHGIISLLLLIILISASPIIALFYREPLLVPITAALSFGIIIQMLSTNHLALLKRNLEFNKIAINQIFAGVFSVIFAVLLAFNGCGYWAVVARQLTVPIIMTIGAWLVCPWRPSFSIRFNNILPILKYATKIYGNFTLGYFTRNLDKILIGYFQGSSSLGIYDRAYHLSSMPAEQLVTPLHSVALSTLSRLRDDSKIFCLYYCKSISSLTFIGGLIGLIFTVSGKDIIILLLGSGWEKSGLVVMAFGPGIAAHFIYSTNSWIHLSLGQPGRWLRWNLFSFAVISTFITVSSMFSPVMVAVAYSTSYYVLMVPSIWYAGRPIRIKIIPIIKELWPYYGSLAITCVLWIVFLNVFSGVSDIIEELNTISRLCIMIPATTLNYMFFVIIFSKSFRPFVELRTIVRTFISKKMIVVKK